MLLELSDMEVRYGTIRALKGVSLAVDTGEVVTLLGANGAGKTTTLRTISGLLHPAAGTVRFGGEVISGLPPHRIVAMGIGHVPEGRRIFPDMSVVENLEMGAYQRRGSIGADMEQVFELFPELDTRRKQIGGTLSGGEQQMLAIGRALMGKPKFLMLDEPSLGIAPRLIATIFEKIAEINRTQGITILLVEQNAHLALEISRFAYVLETGRVVLQGESSALRADPQLKAAYLGG